MFKDFIDLSVCLSVCRPPLQLEPLMSQWLFPVWQHVVSGSWRVLNCVCYILVNESKILITLNTFWSPIDHGFIVWQRFCETLPDLGFPSVRVFVCVCVSCPECLLQFPINLILFHIILTQRVLLCHTLPTTSLFISSWIDRGLTKAGPSSEHDYANWFKWEG